MHTPVVTLLGDPPIIVIVAPRYMFGAVLMDMNRTGVAHGFEPHVLQVCSKVFLMSSTGPYRI